MIEFEKGSTNFFYADLGFPDAEEMFGQAQLATTRSLPFRFRPDRRAARRAALAP